MRRIASLAGLLGPALFVATFTIEGCLRPGYDARSMFVSELSLGPRGPIQITNFLVFGALLVVFAGGLAAELRTRRAGPVLLALVGVGLFASGPLVMDPPGTPWAQATAHGIGHSLFGALVFSLVPASCFVFLRRFRDDARWSSLRWPTLAAATITTAAVVLMKAGPTRPPAAPNEFNAWNGLLQRMVLIPYCAWLFAVAWRLRRATGQPSKGSP